MFFWQVLDDSHFFAKESSNGDNGAAEVSLTDVISRPENDESSDDRLTNVFSEETVKKKFIRVKQATTLRKKDDNNSDKVSVLRVNSEAEYLSESHLRYQVKCEDGKVGWVVRSCCEEFEKEVTIRHIPQKVSGGPVQMEGTEEGDGLRSIMNKYHAVGASVAVIRDGRVAYHYEFGFADREKKVSVSENTKFRIASMSKVVTSMLAMAETDEGKLDLDEDLSKIFGFTFRNPTHKNVPVTTRMLLTHSSGFCDRDDMYSFPLRKVANSQHYYVSKPGTSFLYSNLNLGIAGAVVEKTANQTISQYARDTFFQPMGIDASYDARYLSDKSLVANCYYVGRLERDNKTLTRKTERGNPGDVFQLGQGGLLISSIDLARLFTILLNDGKLDGKSYLSKAAVDQMLTVQDVNTKKDFKQCIGIRKYPKMVDDRDLYYHNGAFYGIFALMAIDPADKSGVVVVTSGAQSGRLSNTTFQICNDVLHYTYSDILK